MLAAHYSKYGRAEDVLFTGEIPTPSPSSGEVLVRLTHSGVNPSDAKARAGARPGATELPFPKIIPHSDGAGIVEAVGHGVDANRIGSRVWIWNGQWNRAFGTAAQFIALPSSQAVDLPESASNETGAALGIPGLTACHAVFGSGSVSGRTLLVSGGGGAVGHNAVQLAKKDGATVIATASPASFERIAAAGADHVLDYSDVELAGKILELSRGGIDRAIEVEFGANASLLAEVMKPMGTIAAYGSGKAMSPELPFGPYLFKALKIDITLVYILPPPERQAAIGRLHRAIARGELVPSIDRKFKLAECAAAHDAVMAQGRAGAVILEID
ncbi:MAG: NADPH:quinone reductase [Roseovarius sp.]|nr:NADPH:quinone reductase [Roseovarius sp.]